MNETQIEVLRCYVAATDEGIAASATDIADASGIAFEHVQRARDYFTGAGLLTKANSARRRIPRDPEIRARIAALVG